MGLAEGDVWAGVKSWGEEEVLRSTERASDRKVFMCDWARYWDDDDIDDDRDDDSDDCGGEEVIL